MSRAEPIFVAQIAEIDKYHKKLQPAIHTFNSLILDDKTRWYSEELVENYFPTKEEFQNYMKIVKNKPMDFGTIQMKILNEKYKTAKRIYDDMELVLKNAMTFNTKGDTWYDEAERLHLILTRLKKKKIIKKSQWVIPPKSNEVRTCNECNNIMKPSKSHQMEPCNRCSTNIDPQKSKCYICYNHPDGSHSFCQKCVKKWCTKCYNWHVGTKCNAKQSKKAKEQSYKSSNNYGLNPINLSVPIKPPNIKSAKSFDEVICRAFLMYKMEAIIKMIKTYDKEQHFFKKVEVEGYLNIIKHPIHFGEILKRINKNEYANMGHIKHDIDLLWSNCYTFNGKPEEGNDFYAFSNFAYELECVLQKYLEQFEAILIKQNWIDPNGATSSSSHSSFNLDKAKKNNINNDETKSSSKSSKPSSCPSKLVKSAKYSSINIYSSFESHMSQQEALKLVVGDKIDHRVVFDKFVFATVIGKQGTNLKIHYNGWPNSWDTSSDFTLEIHRFARAGSISKRPAHRFCELKKGDYIDINPTQRHRGWKCAEIRGLDPKSGQVHVVYEYRDKHYLYWAHLDNTEEIAEFTSKSVTDHATYIDSKTFDLNLNITEFNDVLSICNLSEPLNSYDLRNIFSPLIKIIYNKAQYQWQKNYKQIDKNILNRFWRHKFGQNQQIDENCKKWINALALLKEKIIWQYSINDALTTFNQIIAVSMAENLERIVAPFTSKSGIFHGKHVVTLNNKRKPMNDTINDPPYKRRKLSSNIDKKEMIKIHDNDSRLKFVINKKWNCSMCTFLNEPGSLKCAMCSQLNNDNKNKEEIPSLATTGELKENMKETQCASLIKAQQILSNTFKVPMEFLDIDNNKCYCYSCHGKRRDKVCYFRGTPAMKYILPIGWSRIGLSVDKGKCKINNVWNNWHVAYHGCCMDTVKAIFQSGLHLLKPGDLTINGDQLPINTGHYKNGFLRYNEYSKQNESFDPNQIFVSPSIKYAEGYAKPFGVIHNGYNMRVKCVFQLRIRPRSYKIGQQTLGISGKGTIIDENFNNNELEWYTKENVGIVVHALLIKVAFSDVQGYTLSAKKALKQQTPNRYNPNHSYHGHGGYRGRGGHRGGGGYRGRGKYRGNNKKWNNNKRGGY